MRRFWASCILAALLGCKSAGKPDELPPAAAPRLDAAPATDSASAPAVQQAAAPPPDFDGNWFVLEPGQTVEQLAAVLGVPEETVRTRARQVDFHWLSQLERDLELRFPEVKEAWGGRL